jgi:hypothetical protein
MSEPQRSRQARALAEAALVRIVTAYGKTPEFVLLGGLVPDLLLRKQNWRTNSAAGPTPRPGRSGHSNATGWPGGFSEEGTYRPDRMLIQASHDAPSRLGPHAISAPPPFVSPVCLRTRGSTGIISRT